MAENKTLKVVGISCAVLVLLSGVVMVVLAFLAKQKIDEFKDDLANPDAKARQILSYESLPEGYFANFALAIPFIADSVMISDSPNEDDKPNLDNATRGFLYTKIKLAEEKDSQGLEAFFSGQTNDTSVLRKNNIDVDFDDDDILNRGLLNVNGMNVRYLVTRGGMSSEHFSSEGLSTIMLFQCEDQKMRFGIWFSQQTEIPGGDTPDLAGTVGDEGNISSFIGNFQICGNNE